MSSGYAVIIRLVCKVMKCCGMELGNPQSDILEMKKLMALVVALLIVKTLDSR